MSVKHEFFRCQAQMFLEVLDLTESAAEAFTVKGLTNCFVLYSTYIVKSGSQSRETVPLSVFNPSLILV